LKPWEYITSQGVLGGLINGEGGLISGGLISGGLKSGIRKMFRNDETKSI